MKVPLAGSRQIFPAQENKQTHDIASQKPAAEKPSGSPVSQNLSDKLSSENKASPAQGVKPPAPPSRPSPTGGGFFRVIPFVVGLFVVAFVIFLAVAIVPRFLSKPTNAQLTYWGLWEDENIITGIISDFEKENPTIKIKYQKQSIKQYGETLVNRISQGNGPDIFRFHNTWVPMLRNYLVPIPQDIYSNSEFEKTFYPVTQQDLKLGPSYGGIPLEIDTLALFINDDIFKAAGVAPPTTWFELRNVVGQLRTFDSDKRIQTAGIAMGSFDNVDGASDILALMMIQSGVDFKKVDATMSQDGKNIGEDTLVFYTSFSKGDSKVWDSSLDSSTLAFAKGKLALYFGYSWRVFDIKALNPSLNFRVIPPPQLTPSTPKTLASYWVEGVSKKSPFQKEAFIFLKYLSKKETMQKLYAQEAKVRLFGEPYSRVDMADSLKDNKDVGPFLAMAKDASSWYLTSNTYDNGLDDRMIQYFANAVGDVVTDKLSAKSALETAAKGVSELARQYGF